MFLLGYAFGIGWLDAIIRLVILVGFATVNVLILTWAERKVLGKFQQRLGPTRTGPMGLLQSVADAGKLLTKEDLKPTTADRWVFDFAPFVLFVPILVSFIALPYAEDLWVRSLPLGLFFVVGIQSVTIVGVLMAGWGSDSKYALLGGLRAVAQMISYEIPLVISVLCVAMLPQSLDFIEIVGAQANVPYLLYQPLPFLIFVAAVLAELNRQPFDMAVGESELSGGPFIEYSGIRWSMFQLGEYTNLFVMALLAVVMFLGGYAWPFAGDAPMLVQILVTMAKLTVVILFFFWLRASLPRLRLDQLMSFAWKVLIPLCFIQVFLNGLVLTYDLPLITLTATGIVLIVGTAEIIRRGVRRTVRPPREQRPESMRIRAARGLEP